MITSYVDKDTADVKLRCVKFGDNGEITSISSSYIEDDSSYAWFSIADVLPFLSGEKKVSDFVVAKTKNPLVFSIIKREVEFTRRNNDNTFQKVSYCKDAEIMLSLKDEKLKVRASQSVLDETDVDINNEVTIAGKKAQDIYVTMKDEPNFILGTISVPFNILLGGEVYEHNLPYSEDEVSFYLRKYFNEYSME